MIEDLVGGEGAPTGTGRTWKLGARGKHQSEMMSSAPAEETDFAFVFCLQNV